MMLKDLTASGTIVINAEVNKVWAGLTNPEIIKKYLYGTETITDWKKGNSIIFQGEYNGQAYKDKGIVTENIPSELLSYKYWSGFSGTPDLPENYSDIIYKLKSLDGGKTEFTWIQKGFTSTEGHQHSSKGMDTLLNQIKTACEEI